MDAKVGESQFRVFLTVSMLDLSFFSMREKLTISKYLQIL